MILTWDNLVKRGFVGPDRCVLYGEEAESIDHLMVNCSFTKEVWSFVLQFLHIKKVWGIGQLSLCFRLGLRRRGLGRKFIVSFVGKYGDIKILLFLKVVSYLFLGCVIWF
jgi:hypothetical protein